MKKRKYGFPLLMGGIYLVLSLGLLVAITGAKYADQRTVYPVFAPADFNAAILLQNPQPGEGQTQVIRADVSRARPGMVGESALRIPFYVSNGPNEANTAGVPIQYTIRVRSNGNLPLLYTLEQITETGPMYYSSTVAVEQKPATAQEQTWYERSFYLPVQNAVVQLAEGTVTPSEHIFTLAPETLGDFAYEAYELVVQWPRMDEESHSSDTQYMKEVEIVEILVTASSVNRLEEPDYIPETVPTEAPADTYTPGVILLKEPLSSGSKLYSYTIDLRAFQKDATWATGTFRFYVNNAVGYGTRQTSDHVDYSMVLKVPMKRTGTAGAYQYEELALSYAMTNAEGNVQDLTLSHYRIYNEKTEEPRKNEDGTIKIYTLAEITAEKIETHERPYAMYTGVSGVLNNWKSNNTGGWEQISSKNEHSLIISGEELKNITENPVNDSVSFLHKLELEITATFEGRDPSVKPDSGNTDTPENNNEET